MRSERWIGKSKKLCSLSELPISQLHLCLELALCILCKHSGRDKVKTLSLVGIRSMQVPQKFSGFFFAAEKDFSLVRSDAAPSGVHNVGTFQLSGDALTKFSERCPNAVTQTNSLPKSEIQVNWVAPPAGSGCIAIRATVVEHRDVWYMDDGPLSKIFCEDEADSVDTQPPVSQDCWTYYGAKKE